MSKVYKNILTIIVLVTLVLSPLTTLAKTKRQVLNPQEKLGYININWWDNFSDPYLKDYIIRAVEHNHDAKKASWQVEEYRQFVKYQFGSELPSLSIGGTYVGAHYPESIKGVKSNTFVLPLQASYEADIFLKNHDKTKSSKKAYESSKYQEKAVYISLASDVATVYINIVKYDKKIQLQNTIVLIKKELYTRELAKYERGTVSVPELNNVKKDYKKSKNDLEELEKAREKSLTQLAVLIGESPNNISELKRGSFDGLIFDDSKLTEISSDVVFSRPDVLSVEAELQKAKIDIKVARKEFLPTISVNGLYALSNIGTASFGSWGSTIAAILAGVSQDLFTGGRKFANLRINQARYEQMFEKYRQVDLVAIKEVNDSLMMINNDKKIDVNTGENLLSQKDNFIRAKESYQRGTISYLKLLSEQSQYIESQQNKVESKTTNLVDYITLYKAVGGSL